MESNLDNICLYGQTLSNNNLIMSIHIILICNGNLGLFIFLLRPTTFLYVGNCQRQDCTQSNLNRSYGLVRAIRRSGSSGKCLAIRKSEKFENKNHHCQIKYKSVTFNSSVINEKVYYLLKLGVFNTVQTLLMFPVHFKFMLYLMCVNVPRLLSELLVSGQFSEFM